MQTYIGVDVGGSHITAAPVNLNKGQIDELRLYRASVNPHANANDVLNTWAQVIAKAMRDVYRPDCLLCIAVPGPFDYEQGICLMQHVNKYDALYGLNIRQELAKRLALGSHQIMFRNDAEAFIEGEMRFGAGQSFQKGMGITLGTGLGTSLFEYPQAQDLGLGITHPLYDGAAEDYLSTRWFLGRYLALSQQAVTGVKELAARHATDRYAQQVFAEFVHNLTLVLSDFMDIYHPEIIVLGGNITQSAELFFPQLKQQLASYSPQVTIRLSVFHELAGLLGAVGLELSKTPFDFIPKH
ncbi:MAG: ROK family protein [Spirosomataceae bacterium]